MKRLLAIDGGGIRGVFSLHILAEMERQLREQRGDPSLTLSDHFHYIGGTSTGAIIAACLSWGFPVSEILDLYQNFSSAMFRKRALWLRYWSKFTADSLTQMLQQLFSEDGEGEVPALLGTEKLRTLLLVVTRNASTGSPWPLTNNPKAKFNQAGFEGNNLLLPLWQVIRASTAAPAFFPPEKVVIRGDTTDFSEGQVCSFEDGGITPYNNPAFLLYLKATLPEYRLGWPTGEDNLHLVSVGSGLLPLGRHQDREPTLLQTATRVPLSLMQAYQRNQDLLCRTRGRCLFGAPLDSELGDLIRPSAKDPDFTYVRYNHSFTVDDLATDPYVNRHGLRLDNLRTIPFLNHFGQEYASRHVSVSHLR